MPLSPRETSLLIEGSTSVAGAALGTALAPSVGTIASVGVAAGLTPSAAGLTAGIISGAVGGLAGGIAILPLALGLTALLTRPRFPRVSLGPGGIGESLRIARDIRTRGLTPVITTDPFSGNISVSTPDQSAILSRLQFEANLRRASQPTAADIDLIRQTRQRFIEEARRQSLETVDLSRLPTGRFGVIRETPDSPLLLRPIPQERR